VGLFVSIVTFSLLLTRTSELCRAIDPAKLSLNKADSPSRMEYPDVEVNAIAPPKKTSSSALLFLTHTLNKLSETRANVQLL